MSGLGAALAAGAAVLALGAATAVLRGGLRAGLALQALGVGTLGVSGLVALVGARTAGSAFHGGVDPALGVDGLTGFFLLALGLTAVPALVYARGYLAPAESASARAVGALTGVFLLSLAGVVCARDAATLLLFWELMTLAPASAILAARRDDDVRRHVFSYLAITHLGGAGVWIAMLELARVGALDDPGALAGASSTQVLVGLAAVVGFGTKAGLMPFHTWLPRAHPIAPSHVSALMSGLMVKVALYGLIRVCFQWLGGTPLWLGTLLLALGGLSALGGVLYALFQRDLKRLLAFSSIENVGIVVLGLGASLLLAERGDATWAAVAFGGALLHVLAHGVFKGLLFLAAGAIDHAVHGLELDRLGGLLRRMPWTGWSFVVGAVAIAGVPPLAGFPSEWLALQSLLHVATDGGVGVSIAGALAVTVLGLTGALALFCFAKVVGLVLLGQPRRRACAVAHDPPVSMRVGMAVLAVLCLVLGVVPGLLLPELAKLAPTALALPHHGGLELPGTGSLPGPESPSSSSCSAAGSPSCAGAALGLRAARRARPGLDVRRLHEGAAADARGGAAARTADRDARGAGRRPGGRVRGRGAPPLRDEAVPPGGARVARRCGGRPPAPVGLARRVRRLPRRARRPGPRTRARGSALVTGTQVAAGAIRSSAASCSRRSCPG
ncbi:MAG: proton-conducting transporter membrane subunit [Thermoleophilia bacterium]